MCASRDLSARIEHSKDSVQRKLAGKELECERAIDTIQELEREIAALKDRNNRYVTTLLCVYARACMLVHVCTCVYV